MIKEDYVNFEIAKLLKEKGFVELTNAYYDEYGQHFITPNTYIPKGYSSFNSFILCPTHQMVMKWLREKYHIDVCIFMNGHGYFFNIIFNTGTCIKEGLDEFRVVVPELEQAEIYQNSYEETVEAGLKFVLKYLI